MATVARRPLPVLATVGIIVNPHAGKDIRRLVSAAGQTSDAVKIGIMRRVAAGALEQGAERLLLSTDTHHLAERAVEGLDGIDRVRRQPADRLAPRHDRRAPQRCGSRASARSSRSVVTAPAATWPPAGREVPLIAISTGTNNVLPVDRRRHHRRRRRRARRHRCGPPRRRQPRGQAGLAARSTTRRAARSCTRPRSSKRH